MVCGSIRSHAHKGVVNARATYFYAYAFEIDLCCRKVGRGLHYQFAILTNLDYSKT